MKDGRIIEKGNRQALIARGGRYAGLYNATFRKRSLE